MPIILKLCQNALVAYYSTNYASIFGSALIQIHPHWHSVINSWAHSWVWWPDADEVFFFVAFQQALCTLGGTAVHFHCLFADSCPELKRNKYTVCIASVQRAQFSVHNLHLTVTFRMIQFGWMRNSNMALNFTNTISTMISSSQSLYTDLLE